jgi:DNA-binding LacI/PurR family transcriptional regulator
MSVVTMADVAKAAKVSRPTVSMVLNGCAEKWRVGVETSKRILQVAEKLGYRKNLIARSMATGKNDLIGIVGSLDESFGADILRGIAEVTDRNNYSLKYFRGETVAELEEIARNCVGQRMSGVICHLNDFNPSLTRELSAADIPLVHVDNYGADGSFSCVGSDDFGGAIKAVEYLHGLGHRRIAHITCDLGCVFAKLRHDGFCAGVKACGLGFDGSLLGIVGDEAEITSAFRRVVKKILKAGPTAVFCGADSIAMKTLKIAVESGVRIPGELSIIGFAGLDYTQWTVPALTTVRQPFVEMGRIAAEVLLSEIKDGTPCREVKLPVELVIRDSTAIAKKQTKTKGFLKEN